MKKTSKPKICVVIPAFNEASTIGDVIAAMKKELGKSTYTSEILVIDDGSKDKTVTIAKKSGAFVVSHILNTGAGGATATGLSYAKQNGFDIAATMDADGQHAPKDVVKGIDEIIKLDHDLLIGSRLINSEGMSRIKILGNKGLSFITYVLFRINSTDSQSGLRIFSRRALEELQWETQGYEFCSEMLWRAKQIGLKISEYPIKAIYTEYSKQKGQSNWNAINIVKSLLKRRIAEIFG
jgi:glycosyltransferase involved in cell wall biosynthesis